jgi:hypothetical protein
MHGIEIGDKFRISAGAPPHAVTGSLQVFSVFDETAVGIIIQAEREIVPGDIFGNTAEAVTSMKRRAESDVIPLEKTEN